MLTSQNFKIVHNYRNCDALTFYDSEYVWTIVHKDTNSVIMTFYGFKCNKDDVDRDCVEDVHLGVTSVITTGFDKTILKFKLPISCEKITQDVPFKDTFHYAKTLEIPNVSLDDVIIQTEYLAVTYDDNNVETKHISSNYLDVIRNLKRTNSCSFNIGQKSKTTNCNKKRISYKKSGSNRSEDKYQKNKKPKIKA